MAAGSCLGLLAQAVGNDILLPPSPVIPYIQQNIQNPNWHLREAAIMAFGSILEGPELKQIVEMVSQALPLIVTQITDTNVLVKDTVAWTLGRICDLCPEAIGNRLGDVCLMIF